MHEVDDEDDKRMTAMMWMTVKTMMRLVMRGLARTTVIFWKMISLDGDQDDNEDDLIRIMIRTMVKVEMMMTMMNRTMGTMMIKSLICMRMIMIGMTMMMGEDEEFD